MVLIILHGCRPGVGTHARYGGVHGGLFPIMFTIPGGNLTDLIIHTVTIIELVMRNRCTGPIALLPSSFTTDTTIN